MLRYPKKWAMGWGMRFHLGAGMSGFKNRSISKFQLEILERELDPSREESAMEPEPESIPLFSPLNHMNPENSLQPGKQPYEESTYKEH